MAILNALALVIALKLSKEAFHGARNPIRNVSWQRAVTGRDRRITNFARNPCSLVPSDGIPFPLGFLGSLPRQIMLFGSHV